MKTKQAYFEVFREFDKRISFIINTDSACDLHFHSNIEILYVVSGEVDCNVRGVEKRLSAGDIAIAAGYEPHGFSTPFHSEINVFMFPSDSVPDFAQRIKDNYLRSSFLMASPRKAELLSAMTAMRSYADRDITLAATGYMYTILGILSEELGLSRRSEGSQSELLIRKLLMYIEEHFREPLTLTETARVFGYHKDYLSKVFNTRIGCGFSRYINLLRARHARHLIKNGSEHLDEVALLSGFQCMKTFRRAFSEFYGQTPYEYRQEVCRSPEK